MQLCGGVVKWILSYEFHYNSYSWSGTYVSSCVHWSSSSLSDIRLACYCVCVAHCTQNIAVSVSLISNSWSVIFIWLNYWSLQWISLRPSLSVSYLCFTCLLTSIPVNCSDKRWHSVWGSALQTGRSRDRFPMVSLEVFIDIILSAALRPWGRLTL
jgi:hypothetical protein